MSFFKLLIYDVQVYPWDHLPNGVVLRIFGLTRETPFPDLSQEPGENTH